jgi:hypothetical protein
MNSSFLQWFSTSGDSPAQGLVTVVAFRAVASGERECGDGSRTHFHMCMRSRDAFLAVAFRSFHTTCLSPLFQEAGKRSGW